MARGAELPSMVEAALRRVCALVEPGWRVGGEAVDSLTEGLYTHWYTRPAAPPPVADDPPLLRDTLHAAFAAAHAAAERTEGGWTVTAATPRGTVHAVRERRARVLRPGEYVMPLRPGVPPAPGEPMEPVARLDQLDPERALWWAFADPLPQPPVGRLYLNARPATAPRVIHELTVALEPLPHQLKCSALPAACERVDAVVVYHEREARKRVLDALLARWDALGPLLDPAVPPLTCEVRPGLAWADDVDPARSYGENRCALLAEAIEAAGAAWEANEDERLALLVAGLREAGVDPQAPWSA